jgi:hypothetical protein
MMASKDNKHKFADDVEEEVEESMAPKKQRTNDDDNGDVDDGDSSHQSTTFCQSWRRRSLQRWRKRTSRPTPMRSS